MNRSPDEVRAELLAERDATILLFETAQAHLAAVQPEGLRMNYAIDMAKAIVAEEAP